MLELQRYGIPLGESMRLSKENGPAMIERLVCSCYASHECLAFISTSSFSFDVPCVGDFQYRQTQP